MKALSDDYSLNKESFVAGPSIFADRVSEMDNMTDEEIYSLLESSYSVFLSNAMTNSSLFPLRKNARFLTILSQVLMGKELNKEEQIWCNYMIYKELSEIDTSYLHRVYYTLGLLVNQSTVQKLMEIGLNKGLAIYLAVIQKSSFNLKDNILRLNFSIICASSKLMTVQRITDIYCIAFDDISDIKHLFLITIMDTSVYSSDEEDQEWITPDTIKVVNNMNYAILSILESLPIDKLNSILNEYANMAMIEDLREDEVRFSFKTFDLHQFPTIEALQQTLLLP